MAMHFRGTFRRHHRGSPRLYGNLCGQCTTFVKAKLAIDLREASLPMMAAPFSPRSCGAAVATEAPVTVPLHCLALPSPPYLGERWSDRRNRATELLPCECVMRCPIASLCSAPMELGFDPLFEPVRALLVRFFEPVAARAGQCRTRPVAAALAA
jgi:hypothetical protein